MLLGSSESLNPPGANKISRVDAGVLAGFVSDTALRSALGSVTFFSGLKLNFLLELELKSS